MSAAEARKRFLVECAAPDHCATALVLLVESKGAAVLEARREHGWSGDSDAMHCPAHTHQEAPK